MGHSLLSGMQDWQVRFLGSVENNQLAQTLPSDLNGLLSPSVAEAQTIVPERFAMVGMGTSFRYGPSDQGILRRPFVLADIWAGYVWPADAVGYNGRLSMGISLLGPDVLSAGAFYSNVQGGRTNQPFAGAKLFNTHFASGTSNNLFGGSHASQTQGKQSPGGLVRAGMSARSRS